MRIKLERKKLLDVLQIGGSCAIKSKILLPINECIKLEIKDKTLRIYSTDGENSVSKKYGCVDCEDIEYCVPANQLIKYIFSLNCDFVTIEDFSEENKVIISHDNGNLTLPLYNANEFPLIPTASTKEEFFKIDAQTLSRWITIGEPFLVKDDLKPQIESIFVEASDGKMSFCCTDTTMAVSETVLCDECISTNFMISKNSFRQLSAMLKGLNDVLVWNKENHIMFAGGGVLLSIRKKEGKFFNYSILFKGKRNIHCKIDTNKFLNAIKRVRISSELTSKLIFLSVSNNNIELLSDNKEGSNSSELVDCECDGELKIGFNYEKLITAITAIDGDFINMEFNDNKSITIITSCNDSVQTKVALLPMAYL